MWKKKNCYKRKEMLAPYVGETSTSFRLGSQIQKGLFLDTSPILTLTLENQKAKLFLKF
jgi:hypothetical protein